MKLPSVRTLLAIGPMAVAAIALAHSGLSSPQAFAFARSEPISPVDPKAGKHPVLLAQADMAQSSLPGGASSLKESYQDWQVSCAAQGVDKRCVMSQQQADPKTRQRVLAIELSADASGKANGAVVLPFGLALDAGVSITVDEAADAISLRFRTCLPVGCVVALELKENLVAAMRNGTSLQITATPSENDQPVSFSVSLKGFSSALDRTLALSQ
ncbi:invasion associated locus B family protein [Mesorhizobium sp. SB112]|uniref:invasion associated locus B family protein n=1 Tax=Mesorhizobium sp. SB112 TaxID=3151853 RepID=UPI0032648D4A